MHAHRFVWDYWHVPGQYTLLRTPAQDYFPEPLFAKLESALAEYAAAELGCVGMTPSGSRATSTGASSTSTPTSRTGRGPSSSP